MIRKLILILFIITNFADILVGQTMIIDNSMEGQSVTIDDLWNFSITNGLTQTENVCIMITITDTNKKTLLQARTEPFNLSQGLITFQSGSFKNVKYNFPDKSFQEKLPMDGTLPSGIYEKCIQLVVVGSEVELSQLCKKITVKELKNSLKKGAIKKNFDIGCIAETGMQVSTGKGNDYLSDDFAWVCAQPRLTLYGIPLGMQMIYSTQNSSDKQDINSINFSFDGKQLKENVKKILLEQLDKKLKTSSIYNSYKNLNLNELSSLDQILKNPEVLKELKILNSLDSLDLKIKNKYNVTTDKAVDSIKNILGLNKEIEQKKESYEKIINRKHLLDSINDLYKSVDSAYNRARMEISNLNDTKKLINRVKDCPQIKKITRKLLNVDGLQIGRFVPQYGSLTFENMPVKGGAIELSPHNYYVSFLYGNLFKQTTGNELYENKYKTNAMAVGVGYGSSLGSNIRLRYLYFKEKGSDSIIENTAFSNFLSPKTNQVIALSGKLDLKEYNFSLDGEISISETKTNASVSDNQDIMIDSIPYNETSLGKSWWNNIFKSTADLNTWFDYAYKINTNFSFFKGNTSVTTGIKRIGPYYRSLGVPYMMKDLFTWDFKMYQNIYKNKITLNIQSQYSKNDLLKTTAKPTTFLRVSIEGIFKFPKLPVISISYKPNWVRNSSLLQQSQVVTANVNYSYKLFKQRQFTVLTGMYQKSKGATEYSDINIQMVSLSQVLFVSKKVSFNIFASEIGLKLPDSTIQNYNVSLSSNFPISKRMANQIGAQCYFNNSDYRLGFFYDFYLTFARYFNFKTRIGANLTEGEQLLSGQSNKIFYCRTTLSINI